MLSTALMSDPILATTLQSEGGIKSALSAAVYKNTGEQCLLFLHAPYDIPPAAPDSLPIVIRGYRYGTLVWHGSQPYSSMLMLAIARACGDYLRHVEQTSMIRWYTTHGHPFTQISVTARERCVLTAMYEEYKTNAIAQLLTLAPRTVSTYRAQLYQKFQVNQPLTLIRQTTEMGFFRYLNK
jgi:DNA-binding CsgD family transcriptional regulator